MEFYDYSGHSYKSETGEDIEMAILNLWTIVENYYNENYSLYFELDTSDSIKQVQLQIKDSNQQQFIDEPLEKGVFNFKLKDMANLESWSDVNEICFVVFANDKYIKDEKGEIIIKNLSLR